MRWFVTLSYLGAPFHGWQVQPGAVTVQGTVEQALRRLTGRDIAVTGAGRTDAGVNARTMVAHLDLPDDITPDAAWLRSLGGICGRAIAFRDIRPVAADAHARFDATERTYRYFIHLGHNPFAGDLSWQAPPALDIEAMNRAGEMLLGRRDFTSFSKLHTDVKTNICDLRAAAWLPCGGQYDTAPGQSWYFEIKADRFLRNMVRAVVGTLVDIGRGKHRPEHIMEILAARDRCAAGTSMPAAPLFLWDIKY